MRPLTEIGSSTPAPAASHLVRDELLQGVLTYFTNRTGVRALFQDATGYTIVPATEVPSFCSMLINFGRCGLINPEIEMPSDPDQPHMRMCMGGIGPLIIPITTTVPTCSATELALLVRDFPDANAAILTTSPDGVLLNHSPTFDASLDQAHAELILEFTAEVTRWIAHTGYPISFPDLGGSAWCRHVLNGRTLEGALAAVPIKVLGAGKDWGTAYFGHPQSEMEDELHHLSVLAAHTAHTLGFLERLEASQEQALTDSLTALHNRRYLLEQLERELARSIRSRNPVSLIIFDIDDFKQINDAHGHLAGDEALKHVARMLQVPLRKSSTICRSGGGEFCILLPAA